MSEGFERSTVHFSGHVQGVGFRWRTRALAERFPITGYVRNLRDGRVKMVVEGAGSAVSSFLADLQAQMAAHVDERSVETSAATGEFGRFEIRR